jgi:hypothetical protein
MSKNRNRALLNKAINNKEYLILEKNETVYCQICAKRAGRYGATCGPVRWTHPWRRGFKNPRKAIATWQAREYRSWKHNRKKQWK